MAEPLRYGWLTRLALSRRRCTDEGIRIASRYFATVRRAMSTPSLRELSRIVSSASTSRPPSASIKHLMARRTASAQWAVPVGQDMAPVTQSFNQKLHGGGGLDFFQ